MPATIQHLIINSPYAEPTRHWRYHPDSRQFSLEDGRRSAGYVVASESSQAFDDPGRFVPIELVNQIRPRVQAWRVNGYAGVSGLTRRLLEHWHDPDQREGKRFFFCQLEAIETLIWLAEAPAAEHNGLDIPGDGGDFARLCCKMATGSGKTIVMAMLIAWQVLNKIAYPQDDKFSKYIFIVAPGLTVRKRLHVLLPAEPGNYYAEFSIVPVGLRESLRQAQVRVVNWQALSWETGEKLKRRRSVDKRGPKSDEAYAREVLGELAAGRNLIIINDEAHHAWRINPAANIKGIDRAEIDEATKWVGGLDRLHRARRILHCFDFSATPFAPSGKRSTEEALFGWIVSDFGLNDAIESGLVKTPRVVVRDDGLPDAKTYKSKLYHIYRHVQDDLNRKARPTDPLPDLVTNAYLLLGRDWLATQKDWAAQNYPTPPVMITVANRTETAARLKHAFDHTKILIDELCDSTRALHIDSKVLEFAEARAETEVEDTTPVAVDEADDAPQRQLTKAEQAEQLRRAVDTVGKLGQPGEQMQNIISVGMLSEGWDAKTVTHIMGLRAFSSQLLCEQVVGRGLRRATYDAGEDGFFKPEYVNIFGVPFTFMPHEGGEGAPPPPPKPQTRIAPDKAKAQFAITWPNVLRIDYVYQPRLALDFDHLPPLTLNATDKIENAEMAAVVAGKPQLAALTEIDLAALAERFRLQRIVFEVAREVFDQMQPTWRGARENLIAQVIQLVEKFIAAPHLQIAPPLFYQDPLRRRVLLALHMRRIVQHIFEQIHFTNATAPTPVFDGQRPMCSTTEVSPWYTSKPVVLAERCHLNFCAADSTWEAQPAYNLDHHPKVQAWVKNERLGFEIGYFYEGSFHKYRPDFIARLTNGTHLLLEIKGQEKPQDNAKRLYAIKWITAVNTHGGFGVWKLAPLITHPEDFFMAID
jgi:type III restriction enzyme